MLNEILKEIMALDMECTANFKLSNNRFLFVDNWSAGDGDDFTSLELNSGKVEIDENNEEQYVLDEILECATCDFKNEAEIRNALEYIINCCE